MTTIKHLSLILMMSACIPCIAVEPDFYEQSQRGWFWHEPAPEAIEPESPEEQAPPASSQPLPDEKMVDIDVEWLKKNLPQLQANAISNPSTENLGAFYAAQRLMLDYSSQFATKSMNLARDVRLDMPASLLLMVKTLVTMEGLAKGLSPDVSLAKMGAPILLKAFRPKVSDLFSMLFKNK